MERETGTAVRACQRGVRGTWHPRGSRGGDRREDGQQGAGPLRGIQDGEPLVGPRYLFGTTRGTPVTFRAGGRTYRQLYNEAREAGIRGRSTMNKRDLERALPERAKSPNERWLRGADVKSNRRTCRRCPHLDQVAHLVRQPEAEPGRLGRIRLHASHERMSTPRSQTSQITFSSCDQIRMSPPPPPWRMLLVALSSTASTDPEHGPVQLPCPTAAPSQTLGVRRDALHRSASRPGSPRGPEAARRTAAPSGRDQVGAARP